MGPASIAAEFFRPQATDTLAAQSRKTAADDNRFNDYLDEAQGADDARKAEDVKKCDDASRSDAPSKDDVDTADADEVAAAAAATQAAVAQTVVVDIPTETVEAAAQATSDAIDAAQANASQSETASRSDNPDIFSTQIASQDQTDEVGDAVERPVADTTQNATQPTDVADQAAEAESRTNAALKEAAAQPIETAAVVESGEVDPKLPANDGKTTQVHDEQPVNETDAGKKDSYTRAAIGKANENHESVVPHETIQQRKVRDAVEARRVEPANAAANQPRPRKTDRNDSGPAGGQSEKAASLAEKSESTSANLKQTGAFASRLESAAASARQSGDAGDVASIKTGVGDSAAVSALRFLISGQSTPGESSAQGSTLNNVPTNGAAANASAAAGSSANSIVSDLLSGGADKSGGVDGMVRELNASGVPGRYQATLRLDPPSMGTVRIQLNLQQEGLSIQVDTQSKHVSKLIESRLDDLREALSAHGIRVERTDVVTKSPANAETSDRHENSQNHFDQSSADGADYQMPRDAQERNDSTWTGAGWQNTGESSDSSISDIQLDMTQGVADRDVGVNGFTPGAVDLVA